MRFVQNRRARRQSFYRVEHRRQRLVINANLCQRALRRAQVFGHHQRDQIAVVANFIDGDKVLIVADLQMFMGRDFEAWIDAIELFAVDNAQDAGHFERVRRIDAKNSGVRVRTQQCRTESGIRQIGQVFDVLRLTGDLTL